MRDSNNINYLYQIFGNTAVKIEATDAEIFTALTMLVRFFCRTTGVGHDDFARALDGNLNVNTTNNTDKTPAN